MALPAIVAAQSKPIEYIPAGVYFEETLAQWDGFGFNYVEAGQTRDYDAWPQDYGGFSLLEDPQRQEVLELVFGKEGLQPQIMKMFLDPWHQARPGGEFDHERTTKNMRAFVGGGLDLTRSRGDDLEIITTLYGPPPWATVQKHIGGRDLDPSQQGNLCRYMADWVRYLFDHEYPVRYLSLHNEGEDFYRWDFRNGSQRLERFDYNLYWPPEQVNDFLKSLPGVLADYGLEQVKVTNGEPSNWTRFLHWGYADALFKDDEALVKLGLITTHGFINADMKKLSYGTANAGTTSMLRSKEPNLHTWITSFSWGEMGIDFVRMVHEHIYTARVNAIIPWAGIQVPDEWTGGDPNPGTAIRVRKDGSYEITRGYYFYKQLSRAGRRGMSVARTFAANPQVFLIGFDGSDSGHPDAFVLTSNIFIWSLPIRIEVREAAQQRFRAFRSSEDGSEQFKEIGIFELVDGAIICDPPQGTTTTFIGVD